MNKEGKPFCRPLTNNTLDRDISNVDAVDVPPGEYKSDFDKCKAGVQKYVTRYPGTKFNSNAKNLVKAICMNR